MSPANRSEPLQTATLLTFMAPAWPPGGPVGDVDSPGRRRTLSAVVANPVIDVDQPNTWPDETRRWAEQRAEALAGSEEYTSDLSSRLREEEDDFRATFGAKKLLAYHCTRLLPHEQQSIRSAGLRVLDETLVHDRIAAAQAQGVLSERARHQVASRNVYAVNNTAGREDQICFVLGRSTFDEDADGCHRLLNHWGGEAMRGGPGDAPLLTEFGTPTIIVAALNLTSSWRHSTTHPALANVFVGTLLGTALCSADAFYRDPVPAEDVLEVWQPGHVEYDRHARLPG